MSNELKFAQELVDFLYDSPTAFHAVKNAKDVLNEAGFQELKECDKWELEKGGKYYVSKNSSALTAFIVGTGEIEEQGFKIVGAHTDSPGFRVKPNPEMIVEGNYVRLNTESYGGPILNTWMDRPLAIAGRVMLKSEDIFNPVTRLVNINKPILIIPNIAIHMQRDLNKGMELNKQKDMLPLLGLVNDELEKGNYLIKAIAKELRVEASEIIDFDLFLYEYEKGLIMGLNKEFISASRLDDLQMVHAGIGALKKAKASKATSVMVCFDNEEIGSSTKQGADSQMLSNVLERIVLSLGKGRDEFLRSLAKSFMISADNAHAVHPSAPEKHDPTNRPMINKGTVIKVNADQSYTTDSHSDAIFERLCEKAEVPVQKFVNRSDVRGGSTIGPISSTHLDIASVDIGNPTFAMHSIRELAGVKDHMDVYKIFLELFNI
ncbi:aspartyl aminopeptidase [Clostridium collagenovorans DSM 3089]|uniref:Probable M18 family aminopeptidase 2 n=1 Tax=Clostridium collagenovorans DSM 3089 TaxID=1121306 RepID=A0A1M5XW39_9CLOT|nr:M18 family aminopeptidase [Clostridium collagenovorans]SHI04010.1 aspartyl aminopeptidase [Clostridium collagenovorans DSM 3089]